MFCYLINIKKIEFFFIKNRLTTIRIIFWIVTVQDWYRTGPAKAACPLGIFNIWNLIDIDILLVKKSKINAAFLIINE